MSTLAILYWVLMIVVSVARWFVEYPIRRGAIRGVVILVQAVVVLIVPLTDRLAEVGMWWLPLALVSVIGPMFLPDQSARRQRLQS